jgi:hypothetical protein
MQSSQSNRNAIVQRPTGHQTSSIEKGYEESKNDKVE